MLEFEDLKHIPTLWAFDPGQTTGVAQFRYPQGEFVRTFEIETWKGLGDFFPREGDTVVCESIHWKSPAFNPIGLEVIGVLKFLCYQRLIPIYFQSPSYIKGIQQWPIYDFSVLKSQHERDALAHGLMFLHKQEIRPWGLGSVCQNTEHDLLEE